jgi:hypothetical protein
VLSSTRFTGFNDTTSRSGSFTRYLPLESTHSITVAHVPFSSGRACKPVIRTPRPVGILMLKFRHYGVFGVQCRFVRLPPWLGMCNDLLAATRCMRVRGFPLLPCNRQVATPTLWDTDTDSDYGPPSSRRLRYGGAP